MKKYERHNGLAEISRACVAKGWLINTDSYDAGGDYILIAAFFDCGVAAKFLFSMVSGRLFGNYYDGKGKHWFSSDNAKMDKVPWFNELMETFFELIDDEPDNSDDKEVTA